MRRSCSDSRLARESIGWSFRKRQLTDLHKEPGQLRDMLGGDAARPQQQALASPITDILSSPMAKAVLAGIAAMVVKRVVDR
jgi:hypothetical protein